MEIESSSHFLAFVCRYQEYMVYRRQVTQALHCVQDTGAVSD